MRSILYLVGNRGLSGRDCRRCFGGKFLMAKEKRRHWRGGNGLIERGDGHRWRQERNLRKTLKWSEGGA